MARSQPIKPDPEPSDRHIIHQSCTSPQSINSSTVTPAPEQMYSSGNTTVPDHDVQMGGIGSLQQLGTNGHTLNGDVSHSHDQVYTNGHGSVHSQDAPTPQAEDDAMHNIGANSRKLIQAVQKI